MELQDKWNMRSCLRYNAHIDFTIHICVDGDFETNKTLACIPAVSRIFADLKHVSKNIQKNLSK